MLRVPCTANKSCFGKTGQGRERNLRGDGLFLGPLLLFPTGSSFHCNSHIKHCFDIGPELQV